MRQPVRSCHTFGRRWGMRTGMCMRTPRMDRQTKRRGTKRPHWIIFSTPINKLWLLELVFRVRLCRARFWVDCVCVTYISDVHVKSARITHIDSRQWMGSPDSVLQFQYIDTLYKCLMACRACRFIHCVYAQRELSYMHAYPSALPCASSDALCTPLLLFV